MAHRRFKQQEHAVCDTISCGWEIYLSAKSDVTPCNVGYYAVKTVASNRWMQASTRCPSAVRRTPTQPTLCYVDFDEYFTYSDNPARIAAVHIDFTEWLNTLSHRQRELVNLLASGESTADAARQLGCTPGNISQYRRRLAESWYAYQS
jgi:DNA-binding NarL/FixJ family response regulator